MAETRLSKSQYLRGLQCPKSLWLLRNRKDLLPPLSEAQQALFDQGREIGRLAWQRFPGGRLIEADHTRADEALAQTKAAAAAGEKVLYEAAAAHDGVLVRADILLRGEGGRDWDLIEVKGSTELKDVYLQDVAIQRHVLEGAGYPVKRIRLMHIDKSYVRSGPLEPEKLFTLEEVTAAAAALDVRPRLRSLRETLALSAEPEAEIGHRCRDPYACDFIPYCWKGVPKGSVFELARVSRKTLARLRAQGLERIRDIPEDFPLSAGQALQAEVERTGRLHIEPDAIRDWLGELAYPLHFLDFETFNPALPPYDGLRPFQQLPFQASVHVRDKKGGEVVHFEHLADPGADPRPGMAAFLAKAIGPKGSVVAYNAGFEGSVLEALGEAVRDYSRPMRSIKRRLWDLAEAFRAGHYVHPAFGGSWSIKAVLPALAPDMSYEGLAVADGAQAQLAYLKLMSGRLNEVEAGGLRSALLRYCSQDTLAMVRLLDLLSAL